MVGVLFWSGGVQSACWTSFLPLGACTLYWQPLTSFSSLQWNRNTYLVLIESYKKSNQTKHIAYCVSLIYQSYYFTVLKVEFFTVKCIRDGRVKEFIEKTAERAKMFSRSIHPRDRGTTWDITHSFEIVINCRKEKFVLLLSANNLYDVRINQSHTPIQFCWKHTYYGFLKLIRPWLLRSSSRSCFELKSIIVDHFYFLA